MSILKRYQDEIQKVLIHDVECWEEYVRNRTRLEFVGDMLEIDFEFLTGKKEE